MRIYILISDEGYFVKLLNEKNIPMGLKIDKENKTWEYNDPSSKEHSTLKAYKIGQSVDYHDKSWVRGVYDVDDEYQLIELVRKTEAHYNENPGDRHRSGEVSL